MNRLKIALVVVVCALPSCVARAPREPGLAQQPLPDPQLPRAAPGHIVVRSVHARKDELSVSCLAGERLVGGGCDCPELAVTAPIDYADGDTVQAGWRCRCYSVGLTPAVYALCEGIEDAAVTSK